MNKISFSQDAFNFLYDHFDHLAERYYIFQNGLNTDNYQETINNKRRLSYLDCLVKVFDAFVLGEKLEIEEELQHEVNKELEDIKEFFEKYTVNSEEIRQTVLLLVIKAFKNEPLPLDSLTPDVVGLILTNIIDSMFNGELSIRAIDPMAGSGNLAFIISNYSSLDYSFTFVENNKKLSELLRSVSNLLDIESIVYLQDALQYNLNNHDLLFTDLENVEYNYKNYKSELTELGIKYLPYLLMEKYCSSEDNIKRQIYITNVDFFNHDINGSFKNLINKKMHIDYIITLPMDLFKDPKLQKQILILSDNGSNIKDTLIYMLPNIKSDKFKDVLTEITNNIKERY